MDMASIWKFFENGTDPGDTWTSRSFDDRTWRSGKAPFAYGLTHAGTEVDYGSQNNKHVTTYFRNIFYVNADVLAKVSVGTVELMYDDGVIIYINGQEIGRAGMVRYC